MENDGDGVSRDGRPDVHPSKPDGEEEEGGGDDGGTGLADDRDKSSEPVLQPGTPVKAPCEAEGKVTHQAKEKSPAKDAVEPLEEEVDGLDHVEEDVERNQGDCPKGDEADALVKPKKRSLQCKECGKRFNRRETFNLHRHFHAHEEDLTPLTCKECGLTFEHRSNLIKHRNDHKEEQMLTPKKEVHTLEERGFKCLQCENLFPTAEKLRDHNCNNIPDKPYRCPLCRQEFQFKVSVIKHMQSHSLESVVTCQECNQTFSDSVALRCHQRCHAALKPYQCPECGMVFKHYSVMEDHRRKHTEKMRSHHCHICLKTFRYGNLLRQHKYLHTGQKPFRCPECGKTFAFAQNMKTHLRQHKLLNTSPLPSDEPSKDALVAVPDTANEQGKENTSQSVEPKFLFNCPLCSETSYTPANLRAHMLIHEAEYEKLENRPMTESNNEDNQTENWEKGLTCPHCPSTFYNRHSYNGHLLRGHRSPSHYLEHMAAAPLAIKQQVSPYNDQGNLKSDGSNAKAYKCPQCTKVFRHHSVLELHMRIHSKDRPYQCKVCGKSFRFGSYLQQHLIIHTGEKPYKCPECGKDFAFLQNMKTHQKLHQQKPFRCSSCCKGYSNEAQLKHHMISHKGQKPHKCTLCDKSFGLAYLLRDHLNTHTGERPHKCDECHKSFSWISSLFVHQKIHARKRPGLNQLSSYPAGKSRGRRGRRGSRLTPSWSRSVGSASIVAAQLPPLYQVPARRDTEWQPKSIPIPISQSPMLSAHAELQTRQQKEPWLSGVPPPPVQWKVDGGEVMPVPLPQQSNSFQERAQFDSSPQPGLQQRHGQHPEGIINPMTSHSDPSSQPSHMKESTYRISASLPAIMPKTASPSVVSEIKQNRQSQPETLSGTPTSAAVASTSSPLHKFPASPTYLDGAALWSVRPTSVASISQILANKLVQELQQAKRPSAQMSTQMSVNEPSTAHKKDDSRVRELNILKVMPPAVSQSEKAWNGSELQKQRSPSLTVVSSLAQVDQSKTVPSSTPVSHALFQSIPGIPKILSPSDKLCGNPELQAQQIQQPCWANILNQASTQKLPLSLQFDPQRFPHGLGTAIWGFQTNPLAAPALLTGQLKPGNGQELQHQPIVSGTQIIINQPPFFSSPLAPLPLALPGARPLHSVAVGALARPPFQNIFFTPQAIMSDRPLMPQTLSLPHLVPRLESQKLGGRLPFAPERLLQCMICGHSLPRELDLQLHYLQHSQGEI